MLVWDIVANSVQHVEIKNDYAFYNILVENGTIVEMPVIDVPHPKIKIKYKDTSPVELK